MAVAKRRCDLLIDCPQTRTADFLGISRRNPGGVGLRLRGEMRRQLGAAIVGRGPGQTFGQVVREFGEIGHDAGERPVGEGDGVRPRRRREPAQHDVDAGRLVLAVPFGRQAAREAEAARSGMRRHDPDDRAAPRRGSARGRSRVDRRRPAWSRPGPCRAGPGRRPPTSPACSDEARRIGQSREARAHGRGGLDGGPGQRRIAQRRAELAAARADIEQPADIGHGAGAPAAPRARHSPTCRWPRHRARADRCRAVGRQEHEETTRQTRGERQHVTANCSRPSRAAGCGRQRPVFYIRTPRPMRSRVTAAGGRSPGSRVFAFDHLPRNLSAPSGTSVASSPLTVAGAAAELHRVPF